MRQLFCIHEWVESNKYETVKGHSDPYVERLLQCRKCGKIKVLIIYNGVKKQ